MTREEFESLKYGDKVCIYERRIGIVIMTFGTSAGKAAKIQVRWEDSGWPNDAIQTEFTIDDKEIGWISKLPEIVSTPPGKDFPNVWTGYVSKAEAEELSRETDSLRNWIKTLEEDKLQLWKSVGFLYLICAAFTLFDLLVAFYLMKGHSP